ncbi:MAG: F0F1 ATP synthase subunit A [Acidimicrobiia bacterium]|nr:F0F1 ATP synthase subunit A [Acidimicrobiia bacterium]
MILAAEECDVANVTMCAPSDVSVFFEFSPIIPGIEWLTRTHVLIVLAALLSIGVFYFGLRKAKLVPGRMQLVAESAYNFVDEGIAKDVIGTEGSKYTPYLLSIFMFILFGNMFEVTPLVNFPITSRMAIPAFLALLTYVIFVVAGIRKQGIQYFTHLIWPPGVPAALKPLVGIIELVSVLVVRPFSLAVRLFANLVAGHTMLSLLLGSAGFFVWAAVTGEVGIGKGAVGVAWFVMGLLIYVFEILVAFLQAYIFTLLSAVYIQTSVHPEH